MVVGVGLVVVLVVAGVGVVVVDRYRCIGTAFRGVHGGGNGGG